MHGVRPLRCCRAVTRPLVRQAAGGWHLSLRPTPAPQNLPTPLCLPACLPTPLPQALLALARGHTALLARFGAFLASILDHLEGFSDSQLRQVFDMFAALTTPAGGRPNRVRACVREGSWIQGRLGCKRQCFGRALLRNSAHLRSAACASTGMSTHATAARRTPSYPTGRCPQEAPAAVAWQARLAAGALRTSCT